MPTKQATLTDYQKTIPEHLWNDAESLISYVANYPFAIPENCKFCGSTRFAETTQHSQRSIPQYWCSACKKTFNQLSNTLFLGTKHLELWQNFAELHLAGMSMSQIQQRLTISASAVAKRVDILHTLMKERHPALYKWWIPHYQYKDPTFSPLVKKQANIFIKWLEEKLTSQKHKPCPLCNQKCYRVGRKRPYYYYCQPCNKGFSVWDNTTLKLMEEKHKWIDFVKQLFQGTSCFELARNLTISPSTANKWRDRFIKQAELLELKELVYWLRWQRRRNYAKSFFDQTTKHSTTKKTKGNVQKTNKVDKINKKAKT